MANVAADNAKYGNHIIYWRSIDTGTDTRKVWSYRCAVPDATSAATYHIVCSNVQLTSADKICPVHQLALTNENAITIS